MKLYFNNITHQAIIVYKDRAHSFFVQPPYKPWIEAIEFCHIPYGLDHITGSCLEYHPDPDVLLEAIEKTLAEMKKIDQSSNNNTKEITK